MSETSPTGRLTTYLITAAHLKPTQVYNRLRMVLRKRVLHPSRRFRDGYSRRAKGDEPFRVLDFQEPFCRPIDVAELATGTFDFINRKISRGRPVDWVSKEPSRLWLYHLHSFDYGVALAKQSQQGNSQALEVFKGLIDDWIRSCPVAAPTSWDAYPTSLRIANWIKAYSLIAPALEQDAEFAQRMRQSLYVQSSFLMDHLEYDLLNNHLLENGRALFLAGSFFGDKTAEKWRLKGQRILTYGLDNHFLSDGGHNELSPMYHQIMMEMYLDVAEVMDQPGQFDTLAGQLKGMRGWLASMLHPDGKISLFNDAAFGIADEPSEVLNGESTDGDGLWVLADSGYGGFRDQQEGNYLVFDCGPLGPDHQPGHGHCDALSYELSLGGQRVIVDSGVEHYHEDLDWRTYYRSTRAHNTVVVDGAEQSEIWDRFRVARRAHPHDLTWSSDDDGIATIAGSHTGYQHLPGKVRHRRCIAWVDRRFWVVFDHLTGQGEHHLESLVHFHPDVEVMSVPEVGADLRPGLVHRGDAKLQVIPWGAQRVTEFCGETEPIQGWYAPEFGLKFPSVVWTFSLAGPLPVSFGYVLWPEASPVTVKFQNDDASGSRLEVDTEGKRYRLRFEHDSGTLRCDDTSTFDEGK